MTRPSHHAVLHRGVKGSGEGKHRRLQTGVALPRPPGPGLEFNSSPCCPFKPPRTAEQQEPDPKRDGPGLRSPPFADALPALQLLPASSFSQPPAQLQTLSGKGGDSPAAALSQSSLQAGQASTRQVESQRSRLPPKQCHCFHFCGFITKVKYAYSKHTAHLTCAMTLTGTTAYASNMLSGYKPLPP